MGRKKGTPAYPNKNVGPKTYITTKTFDVKIKAAERRSGKSQSDIVTHVGLTRDTLDDITKDTFTTGKFAAATADDKK